jgi:FtsH-binding integral membrane protein
MLEQNSGLDKFSDRDIRIGFVKKVYSILSMQLTMTAIFVILASIFLNDFVHKNP